MSVRWNPWTGRYATVRPQLIRALGQYARAGKQFKVGVTVDPERRWREHAPDEWSEMVVMYQTSSANYVRQAEKDLIDRGWREKFADNSWNAAPGGEGVRRGRSMYYVYVLLA